MQKRTENVGWEDKEAALNAFTADEQELYEIACSYANTEWDRVAAESKKRNVLMQYSRLRENLVQWLPVSSSDEVLEIGSDCGALTGNLCEKAGQVTAVEPRYAACRINAKRNQNRRNLKLYEKTFQQVEGELLSTYDWIFMVDVLPRAREFTENEEACFWLLETAKRHLASGGKIIFAQENRLKMKERVLSEEAFGIFSRTELLRMVEKLGNMEAEFYYPYPDHLFPLSIFSEAYPPPEGELAFSPSFLVILEEKRL